MRTFKAFLFFSLLYLFLQPVTADDRLDVSIIQLIANPNNYHGRFVRIIGFVRLEFEGNAIYLHEDDYKHGIARNGLWLDVPDDLFKRKAVFDQRYVLLEGTFNAKERGHKGSWSGSIQKISRFQVWSEKDGTK